MAEKKVKTQRYKRWWAIVLFIVVGLIIIVSIFGNNSEDDSKDSLKNISGFERGLQELRANELEKNVSIQFLEEKGYDVIDWLIFTYPTDTAIRMGFTNDTACYHTKYGFKEYSDGSGKDTICWSNHNYADLTMKSLGNRNNQIWDGLMAFNNENISLYTIIILTPEQTCTYYIKGKTYREYTDELKRCVPTSEEGYLSLSPDCFDTNGNQKEEAIVRMKAIRQKVELEIEKYENCS